MSALKYWDGTAWVTLPDTTAKQVWTGPDAPVPVGDHRLWIDTDEPDPALVGSNAWTSTAPGAVTAATSGWLLLSLPTAWSKQGDAGAFTRNADGTLTVRDAGVYTVTVWATFGNAPSGRRIVSLYPSATLAGPLFAQHEYYLSSANGGDVTTTVNVYFAAGAMIGVQSYSDTTTQPRSVQGFGIARVATGPQGVPGPPGPAGFLDVQRVVGLGVGGKAAGATGSQIWRDDAGTVPMRLTYTPPVACWWEVYQHISHVTKTTAEYTHAYAQMYLSPADVDGVFSMYDLVSQHSQVQTYEPRNGHALFKLNAGVAYTANVLFNHSGGSWAYSNHPNEMLMWARAWAR